MMKRMMMRGAAIALMLLSATTAWAVDKSGNCGENGDNVTYTFVESTGTLTIRGTGKMANLINDNPWSDIRDNIQAVIIENGVTSIGVAAFKGCENLPSIIIPASVESIDNNAFEDCSNLKYVIVHRYDANSESKIPLHQSDAFKNCHQDLRFYVPSAGLDTYKAANRWKDYGDKIRPYDGFCSANGGMNMIWAFDSSTGTLTIAGTGAMADYAGNSNAPWYGNRDKIKTIIIENGVTYIGIVAFRNCENLPSVTIPSSVTSIGDQAFEGCKGLTSVTIPDGVTSIGRFAFYLCRNLTSVAIPSSVTSIEDNAFFSYPALESITVDKNNTKYDSREGCNAIIEKDVNGDILILGCKNTVIPSTVTSIGSFAFEFCTSLTSIIIPASVTSIGDDAFYGCTGLTSVTIPSSVTSIGNSAFNRCEGLTSIIIPSTVTSIGYRAFEGCTGVTDVYCFADPDNLTWDQSSSDFIKTPAKTTVCHVAGSKLETFESNWNKGEDTDVNVTFKGDGIDTNGEAYLVKTIPYSSGTIIGDVKTFLPVGYDLSTATVTLAEVKGAPKNLPVIYGSAKDGEKLPDVFFLKYVADDSDEATDIQSDYDNALKDMDKRFVITDGTKTLADVISGTGVDASEAVVLVLANGKFTSVDFSAADLDKKAKAGLLLFVLSKWEYMQIKPATGKAAATAQTRTIGIGDGETTSLTPVPSPTGEGSDWYDLQGRRISKPTKKGIYIYNGKKVIR